MGEWDSTKTYESLSIVQYQGNSFTSRQNVPIGVEITNDEFWVSTGNYNAQIENYRREVSKNTNKINDVQSDITTIENTLTDKADDSDLKDLIKLVKPITVNVKNPPNGLTAMKGDGVSDDYAAYLAIVDYINQNANVGGTLYFPNGTYYIDQFKVIDGDFKNDVKDGIYTNLRNWSIIGENATIKTKGDFVRKQDKLNESGSYTSYSLGFIPFVFNDCDNLHIQGIRVNGSVQSISKEDNVSEGYNYGIRFNGGVNVNMENCQFNNMHQDGIGIFPSFTRLNNGKLTPARNFTFYNVKASNNARQGMTVGHLINGKFISCSFNNTGHTGQYGYHLPIAGVDIEMDYQNQMNPEDYTKDIIFESCNFEENMTSFYIHNNLVENIKLSNCTIKSTETKGINDESVRLNGINTIVTGCIIDVDKHVYLGMAYQGAAQNILFSKNIVKCDIFKCHESFGGTVVSKRIYISNNVFKVNRLTGRFSRGLMFTNNQVEINKDSTYIYNGVDLTNQAVDLGGIWLSSNNSFYTDNRTNKYSVVYETTVVSSDVFIVPTSIKAVQMNETSKIYSSRDYYEY